MTGKIKLLKTGLHILVAVTLLIIINIMASFVYYAINQPIVASILNTVINISLTFAVLLFICKKIFHKTIDSFKICSLKKIIVWLLFAIGLPIIVSGFYIIFVQGSFFYLNKNTEQIITIVCIAVFSSISTGITEEFWFRGYIMNVIEEQWGKLIAILISSVLFALLHIINISISLENIMEIILVIIAGTSVGIMFSMAVYVSKSIWAGVLMHGIWNFLIIGGILHIGKSQWGSSIFEYTLHTDAKIITGGEFGIEAAMPAIIAYIIVIIICIIKNKKMSNVA